MSQAHLTEIARKLREKALYLLDAEQISPNLQAHITEQGRNLQGWIKYLTDGGETKGAALLTLSLIHI